MSARGRAGPPEPLQWWDIEQLTELELMLFPTDSPWSAAMFWAELAAGNHYVVTRSVEGNVVGYAGLSGGNEEQAEVQTIGVRPNAQGNGVGRALLRNLIAAAGDRAIFLDVRTDNAAAMALYSSERFTTIGLRRHYYQPSGADAFTMVRAADERAGPAHATEEMT